MRDTSRRVFLAVSGAGAATVGAAAFASAAVAAGSKASRHHEGPLVAYVSDVTSGSLSIMAGEKEVIIQDRDLVARLARAAASGR